MAFVVTRKTQAELDQEQRERTLREAPQRTTLQAEGFNPFTMMNGSGGGLMGILSAFIAMLTGGMNNMLSGMGHLFGNVGKSVSSGYSDFKDGLAGRGDTPLAEKGVKPNLGFGNSAGTALRGVLDLIGKHESGGDYNRVYGKGIKRVDLTNMTIDEVQAWQKDYVSKGSPSSAAGKYQIIGPTLAGLEKQMGLTGKEKFDVAMQDRMALQLLENRGLSKFAAGQMTTGQIVNAISKEWASIENSQGKGAYDGDGLNAAAKGTGRQMAAALQLAKTSDLDRSSVARKIDADTSNIPVAIKASKISPVAEMGKVATPVQTAQADPVADRKTVKFANGGSMFVGNYDGSEAVKPVVSLAPSPDLNRVTFPNPNKV